MGNRVRLVNEGIFTEQIKNINLCLKKSTHVVRGLKQGAENGDYMRALINLDKICGILDDLMEMSFKEARIHTSILQQNNKDLFQEPEQDKNPDEEEIKELTIKSEN